MSAVRITTHNWYEYLKEGHVEDPLQEYDHHPKELYRLLSVAPIFLEEMIGQDQ